MVMEQIKLHTGHDENGEWKEDNKAANLVAHAILGAVVAELQGNSVLVGGASAVSGELAAPIIQKALYGDRGIKDLTEEEKQNLSALTQLAIGLTIASMGGDTGDVATGIDSSKNAVENNYLGILRVGWQIIKPSKLADGMRPVTLTPELIAAAILVENKNIPYEEAERFINGLTKEQIAELNKQGIAVTNSSYSPEYKAALIDLYNQSKSESNDKGTNSIINDNTISNTEIASNIANNQITDKDWQDYFLTNNKKIEEEWHEGAEETSEDSLLKHYKKHGKELKSNSPEHYLNQAKEFAKNLRGAKVVKNVKGYTQNVTRYYKNGKYIDIAADKRIVSFGKQ